MVDRWVSKPIPCVGGLILDQDALTLGTNFPGSASLLQNFEPSVDGGYRRINGYIKYDNAVVPGDDDEPVLGVKVSMLGVFATRLIDAGTANEDNAIYFSSGSGWGSPLNSSFRPGAVTKARYITYYFDEPVIVQCDGVNPAWRWNGSADTTINGTGAPTNPKYAAFFKSRLALAGYGSGDKVSISSPNDDTDFDGGNGAFEINVGDKIKGMRLFRDSLVIFCEHGIKVLVGTTTADFTLDDIATSIGCLSHDSIQEIGGDLIYLSTDGFRSFAATQRIGDVELGLLSKAIQPLVRDMLAAGFDEDNYSSCVMRKKSQYRLFINNPDITTDADNFGILGRLTDIPITPHGTYEWATTLGFKPYCSDSEYSGNLEVVVMGHHTNGYVYRLESGNTLDGENIFAIYRSQDMTFDDASLRKVFHKLDLYTHVEGDVDFNVQLLLDREIGNIIQPSAINMGQSGGVAVYGTAIYDTDTYGAFLFPSFKKNLIGSGFFGAFQFTCNNDSAPFKLDSFQVQLAGKGRR